MTGTETAARARRARRSCLTVPGTSARMLEKAAALEPDQVVVDLEDAVPPAEKTDATRAQVAAALAEAAWASPARSVRVNGVDTPWFRDDVVQIVRGSRRPSAHDRPAEGRERRRARRRGPAAGRARGRARARPDRARGADRERTRPPPRRPHRRRLAAARGVDLRSRRPRRLARDPAARDRRHRPRLPGRPVALRALADRRRGARQRDRSGRRPVRRLPRPGGARGDRPAGEAPRLRRQVGDPSGPDRGVQSRLLPVGGRDRRAPGG